jgi:basic membrane protein A and related proteins
VNGTRVGAFGLVAVLAVGLGVSAASVSAKSQKQLRVAIVLPGPINDKGFNQTGYEGLQQCKQQGAKVSYTEDTPPARFVKTFQTFARSNDVVIGHGFEFGTIADQVAPQFPNVKFVVTSDALKPKHSNELAVIANSTQGAYLAGALAGLVTKSGKLGGIAGQKFPPIAAQMTAFKAGAEYANKKTSFKVVYLGTFDDVAKGKEAAQSLAATGVDVIYHIADAAGIGVINGAAASNINVVGWGADQHSVAPKAVIASEIVDQAREIGHVCSLIMHGRFPGGTVHVDGLRTGVIGLSRIYNEPASVSKRITQIRNLILAGKVKVPSVSPGIPGSGPKSG